MADNEALPIYVSGPMTGYEDFNRPAFHAATAQLRAAGWQVINPAEHDEDHPDWEWTDFIRADIKILMDCGSVAVLPGWEASKGARLETDLAYALGMTIAPLSYWLDGPPCPACSHTDCTCDGAPITQAEVTTPAQVWDTADRPRERP